MPIGKLIYTSWGPEIEVWTWGLEFRSHQHTTNTFPSSLYDSYIIPFKEKIYMKYMNPWAFLVNIQSSLKGLGKCTIPLIEPEWSWSIIFYYSDVDWYKGKDIFSRKLKIHLKRWLGIIQAKRDILTSSTEKLPLYHIQQYERK